MGKLGFFLPRTLSRAFTQDNSENNSFRIDERSRTSVRNVLNDRRHSGYSTPTTNSVSTSTRPIYRIGGTVIRDANNTDPVLPVSGDRAGDGDPVRLTAPPTPTTLTGDGGSAPLTPPPVAHERTIRFPDDGPGDSFSNERRFPM